MRHAFRIAAWPVTTFAFSVGIARRIDDNTVAIVVVIAGAFLSIALLMTLSAALEDMKR